MTAKTDAERQKLRYNRKKDGLVLVQEWVPADKADMVRRAITAVVKGSSVVALSDSGSVVTVL